MSVVINGTGSISGLSNVGGIASAQSGSVIQTVVGQLTQQTGTSTTSTSFVTTGHTLTITPQFSTSKIILLLSAYCGNSNGSYGSAISIFRNGTNILPGSGNQVLAGSRNDGSSSGLTVTLNANYQDSPASTSALTYTVYMLTNNASNTFTYACANGGVVNGSSASLIAMEIAA
jgi:hypothetical protein